MSRTIRRHITSCSFLCICNLAQHLVQPGEPCLPLPQPWMPRAALFEFFNLLEKKRLVFQKCLLALRSIECIITTVSFRSDPARVTADARSASFWKNSMAVVSRLHNHPLLSPDSNVGRIEMANGR